MKSRQYRLNDVSVWWSRFPKMTRLQDIRVHAVVAVLALTIFAACTPCADVGEDYTDALLAELAVVGTGGRADTGIYDHFRLVLAPDEVGALLFALEDLEPFRTRRAQRTVELAGERVSFDVELRLRVSALSAVALDDGSPALEWQLDFGESRVRVESRSRSVTSPLPGLALVRVPIEAIPDGDGVTIQTILEEAVAMEFDATPAIDVGVPGDELDPVIASLLERAIDDAPNQITVLRIPGWYLGEVPITVEPSRLRVVNGHMELGMVSNLRPLGPFPLGLPTQSEWSVHPGVPLAVVRYGFAFRLEERELDEDGKPAERGVYSVTVDAFGLFTDQLRYQFTLWCLGERPCYSVAYDGSGDWVMNADVPIATFELPLPTSELPEEAIELPMNRAPILQLMRMTVESVLVPPSIVSFGGWQVRFESLEVSGNGAGVVIAGKVDVVPPDAFSPDEVEDD